MLDLLRVDWLFPLFGYQYMLGMSVRVLSYYAHMYGMPIRVCYMPGCHKLSLVWDIVFLGICGGCWQMSAM